MQLPAFADAAEFARELPATALGGAERVYGWIMADPQLTAFFAAAALVPAIFWGWLFVRKGNMDRMHRRFMVATFWLGMLSVPIVFLIHLVAQRLLGIDMRSLFHGVPHETLARILYFVVVVGMVEEYAKHVIVKEVDYRRKFFNRIADGIEFSVAAALGFAFVENIIYFAEAWRSLPRGQFVGVVVVRSIGSMLAHVLFSGIFGYYFGRAKFIADNAPRTRAHHFQLHFLDGIRLRAARYAHFFKGSHVLVAAGHLAHREALVGEGLLIAMVLHGLYDWFLDINRVYLIVPLLFLEFLFIWHELEVAENLKIHETSKRHAI